MIPLKNDVPREHFPTVTLAIVVANVTVFLWQLAVGPASIQVFGAVPRLILRGEYLPGAIPPALTLFTSMFLHAGFLHLGGNMLFLWIFGANVEDRLGHLGYLVFYILCGLLAGTAQVLAAPASTLPMVGASGAIAAVLGAYFLLFPTSRVLTLVFLIFFVRLIYLPAVLFLGLWFLLQLLSLPEGASGGVAFAAHVGGFLAGLLLVWIFAGRRPKRRMAW
ncbi:MAG: rhomboid family intramembrane serine protease [Myxococcales bacterium]